MNKMLKNLFVVFIAGFMAMICLTACKKEKEHVHTPVKMEAVSATCTTDGSKSYWTCSDTECGKVFLDENCTVETTKDAQKIPAIAHTPKEDDGDCTTAITCVECDYVTTEAKTTHTPKEDDGDCMTAITCVECDYVTTEAKTTHTSSEDDGDCTTEVVCIDCEQVVIQAKESHVDNNADVNCDECFLEILYDYLYIETTNTYVVYNEKGLYEWRDNEMGLANLILAKDIVMPSEMVFDLDENGLAESNWKPFDVEALIDGNGHSIKGIIISNFNSTTGVFTGFIGRLEQNGCIQNLTLEDVKIEGDITTGGIASWNFGTIINCGVTGSITSSNSSVAGIVGNNEGKIIACYNAAVIDGPGGGIVAQMLGGLVLGCYNVGNIVNTGDAFGMTNGGVVGTAISGSIIGCYNTAVVSAICEAPYIGGIVGYKLDESVVVNNYWNFKAESIVYGIGSDQTNENALLVDGEVINWSIAMAAMNEALLNAGIDWRYVENVSGEAAVCPLVLDKINVE